MFSTLFRKSCFYEIMSKNLEPERPLMTIWRMRVACWVRLHAHIHMHTPMLPGEIVSVVFEIQHEDANQY